MITLPEKTALVGGLIGALVVLLIWQPWQSSRDRSELAVLKAQLEEVRVKMDGAEPRCVIVNTPVFNLYDIPDLGVVKVRTP